MHLQLQDPREEKVSNRQKSSQSNLQYACALHMPKCCPDFEAHNSHWCSMHVQEAQHMQSMQIIATVCITLLAIGHGLLSASVDVSTLKLTSAAFIMHSVKSLWIDETLVRSSMPAIIRAASCSLVSTTISSPSVLLCIVS